MERLWQTRRDENGGGSVASGGDLINIRWHMCFGLLNSLDPGADFQGYFRERFILRVRLVSPYLLINITFSSWLIVSLAAIEPVICDSFALLQRYKYSFACFVLASRRCSSWVFTSSLSSLDDVIAREQMHNPLINYSFFLKIVFNLPIIKLEKRNWSLSNWWFEK